MKVALISLGCSKNLVDAEVMLGVLKKSGFSITEDAECADIAVVNTCAFIQDAKKEAINTILEVAKLKQKGRLKRLIVAGCLPQRYKNELRELLQEADAFLGPGSINKIADIIKLSFKGKRPFLTAKPHFLSDRIQSRKFLTPKHYAYVKIADGCDNRCSYCVIPQIRGSHHSRTIESIVKEVKMIVDKGGKEINLISQDTTFYGADLYGKPSLDKLLKRLVEFKNLTWIRILYTHPRHYTDSLIDIIARESKICKYVDLPIQHINDKILKSMKRKVSSAKIKRIIKKLREKIPGVTLRTSLIVGFPGETEAVFKELYEFVRQTEFDRLGVFAYSREENTQAAKMKDQVPERIKKQRVKKIMRLQQRIIAKKNTALIGTVKDVLIDGTQDEDTVLGRTQADAPEVDGLVFIKGSGLKQGKLIKVKITDSFVYDLIGKKI
ncbi:MAG: 30S ribosomal protein S12 methylthiotransferase RimO [Candidatus Omnitrophota bacterium]